MLLHDDIVAMTIEIMMNHNLVAELDSETTWLHPD